MKKIVSFFLTALLCSTLVVGCTPAKKPAPAPENRPNRTAPAPTPAKKPAPMPTSSREMHKLATKLAAEAAKVNGVKEATVVLSNTMAYVGIDLQANIEAGKTNSIKKEVADRVKNADKRLTRVYVSSDTDVVTRIKKVAKGIEQGKPFSSFTREIAEIGRRIAP